MRATRIELPINLKTANSGLPFRRLCPHRRRGDRIKFGDVRFWHKADNQTVPAFVCYWSNSTGLTDGKMG